MRSFLQPMVSAAMKPLALFILFVVSSFVFGQTETGQGLLGHHFSTDGPSAKDE
ncbi:MAG: hypothetical protein LC776_07190 [Acidobacteria bacterium]|nr:hypothetical protein [Acidobacteriota bacterium]